MKNKTSIYLGLSLICLILCNQNEAAGNRFASSLWIVCAVLWSAAAIVSFYYERKNKKPKQTLADVFSNMILRDTLIMVVQHEKTIDMLNKQNDSLKADNEDLKNACDQYVKNYDSLMTDYKKCKDELCNHKEK